jgi:phthiocerol/phenolphthiocerol synthesis type-I polyketide synthase E
VADAVDGTTAPPVGRLSAEVGGDPTGNRLSANRSSWDERVPIHAASRFYDVERWLATRPGPRRREVEALGDVTGLDLVHLQCHFGLDTLAWADAGARVTGLDFSPAAIQTAQGLAVQAGLADRASFVCASVYDAGHVLAPRTFDVVYISLGALCWLPSVGRWADQVAAVARPGGRLYLHDGHPVAWALADDAPRFEYTYFEEPEPYVGDSEETYTDAQVPLANTRTYEWNHGIGEVVMALVDRGWRIDQLTEHDWTVHQRFPWLEEAAPGCWSAPAGLPRIPLSYTVVATRTP